MNQEAGYSLNTSGLLMIGALLGLIIYYIFIRKKKFAWLHVELLALFYIYILIVLTKTILPIPLNAIEIEYMAQPAFDWGWINIIPIINLSRETIMHFTLNVILFIPFGILLPLVINKFKVSYVIIYSLIFSIMIEMMQFVLCYFIKSPIWSFDINDIIANFIGGLFGYMGVTVVKKKLFMIFDRDELCGKKCERNLE